MLLIYYDEPYVKRWMIYGYARIVDYVWIPDSCFMDNQFIKECAEIVYDNAGMVDDLKKLYETGVIEKVNIDSFYEESHLEYYDKPKGLEKRIGLNVFINFSWLKVVYYDIIYLVLGGLLWKQYY